MANSNYPYTGATNQACKRTANQSNLLVPKGKVTGWAREARSVASLMTRMGTTPFAIGDITNQAPSLMNSVLVMDQ